MKSQPLNGMIRFDTITIEWREAERKLVTIFYDGETVVAKVKTDVFPDLKNGESINVEMPFKVGYYAAPINLSLV